MFDLDSSIDLEEPEVSVGSLAIEKELNRSC